MLISGFLWVAFFASSAISKHLIEITLNSPINFEKPQQLIIGLQQPIKSLCQQRQAANVSDEIKMVLLPPIQRIALELKNLDRFSFVLLKKIEKKVVEGFFTVLAALEVVLITIADFPDILESAHTEITNLDGALKNITQEIGSYKLNMSAQLVPFNQTLHLTTWDKFGFTFQAGLLNQTQ
ncbi:hypothetical protein O181_017471 [Austropuccinia psidii MF-1]|uniref:Uncharacterized protein n=1 Tax=Austropuccinia psidii MF-1 TaxID=1389203 RepID=A0A9Q3C7N3_9BASI|nr:hypothetical protein [Austropuccinia psidii MF-1]